MSGKLSRRSFLKLTAASAATLATAGSSRNSLEARTPTTRLSGLPLNLDKLQRSGSSRDLCPALSRRYPWLRFGEKRTGLLQIAAIETLPPGIECASSSGILGERIIRLPSGTAVLPWAPLFSRPTRVYRADDALKPAGTGELFIKDEGSEQTPLYGNKIRKYEFMLPNLAYSGVRTLRTYGAYGSNHVAYLTLAARYGRYRTGEQPNRMELELFLYPQEMSRDVLTKLRLLVASGARLGFLEGDASLGISLLGEELQSWTGARTTTAYVPPGGSSPLSVLGHVEAIMELAEQIETGSCELTSPPDYIFVPLGSGATAMGLVLGCYLLGWQTTVVGTCSQDKGTVPRLLVNGDAATPFLVGNAASLLEKSLKWVKALGLPTPRAVQPSAHDLLRGFFAWDSETWQPEYGKVTPEIAGECASAARSGLVLDHTFSSKSFHTMRQYARQGMLRNKTALFWLSYQRFPLERLLPQDDNWVQALSGGVKERIESFRKKEA